MSEEFKLQDNSVATPIIGHIDISYGACLESNINPTYNPCVSPSLSDPNETMPLPEQHIDTDRDVASDPMTPRRMSGPHFTHLHLVTLIGCALFGLGCLLVLIVWLMVYRDGFGFDGSRREFNYHPLLMTLGMVLCYANAALSSYALRAHKVSFVHPIHGASLVLTLLFTVLGMFTTAPSATGNFANEFYGFHAWLGVMTLCLFGCQSLVGFIGLFPNCETPTRRRYLKLQIWISLVVFILSTVTCLLGISDMLSLTTSLSTFSSERVMGNLLSVLLVIFSTLVALMLLHPAYRRV